MATRDEDGFYQIVDRKDNMIITGGENVYPSEIEEVIGSHECVFDCAVVGLPDDKWGEKVAAVLSANPGSMNPRLMKIPSGNAAKARWRDSNAPRKLFLLMKMKCRVPPPEKYCTANSGKSSANREKNKMNYANYAAVHARHLPDKICLIERTPSKTSDEHLPGAV